MKKPNSSEGITLIALIITIIVLLILAGISINMILGENGIIKQAQIAKTKTELTGELEKIKLVATEVKMKENLKEEITDIVFQNIIDGVFSENKAEGVINVKTYIITVYDTNNSYEIAKNGDIEELGQINLPIDETPGVLEGEGTVEVPYEIESIEDLVAFSYAVNSETTTYLNKTVVLKRNLYFSGAFNSYENMNATYEPVLSNDTIIGYIPSETASTTIKELVTTGEGFIPIGLSENIYFEGTFDGQNNFLSGIYVNKAVNYAGLFGKAIKGKICNLGLKNGNITGQSYTGGIIGSAVSGTIIENCFNSVDVKGNGEKIGGIAGSTNNCTITNCYNTGNINGENNVGGVAGNSFKGSYINCYNIANIEGNNNVAGLVGLEGYICDVSGCYNLGNITGTGESIGGLINTGSSYSSISMNNSYNAGDVNGNSYVGGLVGHGCSVSIEKCYNTGVITGNEDVGGILGAPWLMPILADCYNIGDVFCEAGNGGGIVRLYRNTLE